MAVTYRNPVIDRDAPDVTLARADDGLFHAYTTQSLFGSTLVNLPHYVSTDLVRWSHVGDALPVLPPWVAGDVWAPHVHRVGAGYVVYFSARLTGRGDHGIAVATSGSLDHPFRPVDQPLLTRTDASAAVYAVIDPFVLDVAAGGRLLYYGSGHAPIRCWHLDDDGLSLVGGPRDVLQPFESAAGHGRLVEAASVWEEPSGTFRLWVSGDNTHTRHYAVSEFRSDRPDSGFGERANPRNPILAHNAAFAGPGHHALITDDAGQLWVLYHAVAQEDVRRSPVPVGDGCTTAGLPGLPRRLLLDRVITRPDGWSEINGGTGPSSAPMPAPVVRTAQGR